MSMMRPPLTTSMTGPETTPSSSLIFSIVAPGPLVLRPLLGQDQATFLVLLLEDEGLDLVADGDDLAGIDVVADRELPVRDDAFGLVADVEQDLVAVDLDDRSRRPAGRPRPRPSTARRRRRGTVAEVVVGDLTGDVGTMPSHRALLSAARCCLGRCCLARCGVGLRWVVCSGSIWAGAVGGGHGVSRERSLNRFEHRHRLGTVANRGETFRRSARLAADGR